MISYLTKGYLLCTVSMEIYIAMIPFLDMFVQFARIAYSISIRTRWKRHYHHPLMKCLGCGSRSIEYSVKHKMYRKNYRKIHKTDSGRTMNSIHNRGSAPVPSVVRYHTISSWMYFQLHVVDLESSNPLPTSFFSSFSSSSLYSRFTKMGSEDPDSSNVCLFASGSIVWFLVFYTQ
mmetsp:Transcript_11651/g.18026  ORF Transcript_11651/g.18026 Transcript_11651/m.18026 type:complete len:176 (+) Transcript_11651:541-1068(+)